MQQKEKMSTRKCKNACHKTLREDMCKEGQHLATETNTHARALSTYTHIHPSIHTLGGKQSYTKTYVQPWSHFPHL